MERLILVLGIAAAVASGVAAYRISGPYGDPNRDDPRVVRFFDPQTGRLRLLVYDADDDGRFDTWSYMDDRRVLRMEVDDDEDGVIDPGE